MRRHRETQLSEGLHECTECDEAFGTASLLEQHQCSPSAPTYTERDTTSNTAADLEQAAEAHSKVRRYICDICNKEFRDASKLKQHQLVHSGEKPVLCDRCGKRMNQTYLLRSHSCLYSRAILIGCSECFKRFNTHSELENHVCNHAGSIAHQLLELNCSYTVNMAQRRTNAEQNSDPSYLKYTELQFGNGYTCPKCGQGCYSKTLLEDHIYTHAFDFPYKCPICKQIQGDASVLELHLLTHSSDTCLLGHDKEQVLNAILGEELDDILERFLIDNDSIAESSVRNCSNADALFQSMIVQVVSPLGQIYHVCPYCNEPFNLECDLEEHVSSHESESRSVSKRHSGEHVKSTFLQVSTLDSTTSTKMDEQQLQQKGEDPFHSAQLDFKAETSSRISLGPETNVSDDVLDFGNTLSETVEGNNSSDPDFPESGVPLLFLQISEESGCSSDDDKMLFTDEQNVVDKTNRFPHNPIEDSQVDTDMQTVDDKTIKVQAAAQEGHHPLKTIPVICESDKDQNDSDEQAVDIGSSKANSVITADIERAKDCQLSKKQNPLQEGSITPKTSQDTSISAKDHVDSTKKDLRGIMRPTSILRSVLEAPNSPMLPSEKPDMKSGELPAPRVNPSPSSEEHGDDVGHYLQSSSHSWVKHYFSSNFATNTSKNDTTACPGSGGDHPHSSKMAHVDPNKQPKKPIAPLGPYSLTPTERAQHTCGLCGKKCNSLCSLRRHKYLHSGSKPHACPHCDKRFARQSHLKDHVRSHTGVKPYTCTRCSARFARKDYLAKHIRVHTGEKPYVCPHCDNRFNTGESLKFHKYTHTGHKPLSCSQCGMQFRWASTLKLHVSRIHTHARSHPCTLCTKGFDSPEALRIHESRHRGERPYVCDRCDKRFHRPSILKEHILTHTGEKTHACNECGKRFSSVKLLQGHQSIHMRDDLPICEICRIGFTSSSDFKEHMETHVCNDSTLE